MKPNFFRELWVSLMLMIGLMGCGPMATNTEDQPMAESTETVRQFLERSEQESLVLGRETGAANWVRATYLTPDTAVIAAKAGERGLAFQNELFERAMGFRDQPMDAESARIIELILRGSFMPAPNDEALRAELSQVSTALEGLYGAGEYCDPDTGICRSLPELENVLATSRDYDEQLQAWIGWRTVSVPMRPMYERFVELNNIGARDQGYEDLSQIWKGGYDMDEADFDLESDRLWSQVEPLYESLQCHVRAKLNEQYGDSRVPLDAPIPAHLLGNMWAQTWSNIYDLVEPYPGVASLDVTASLQSQNYDAVRMTEMAEAFFTSLGLPELPQSFWQNSMLTKPVDRDVVCHASAWDLDNGNDPRIKQCVEANEDQLITLHHELGHIYYFLLYKDQRPFLKGGAHDGFHEAVGDTIVLSMTPAYLQAQGLVPSVAISIEALINQQMKLALDRIAFLPFGKLMDHWRWPIFTGEVSPEDFNESWWALRREYQGVAPPVPRSEADFDPGAKYHIPAHVPYMRYFLSHVMQFQFHQALCDASGYEGPLHDCSIYGSEAAGERLGAMLSMGASQPWPNAMRAITGQERMDAQAILAYFAPLSDWLAEQNQGRQCGW